MACHTAACAIPAPGTEPELDRGDAGASLTREYERRKRTRAVRARRKHPRLGALLLALTGEPEHQRALHIGDIGEKAVGESLEKHVRPPAIILMNRRMPNRRADIDFLAIAPSGVFVAAVRDALVGDPHETVPIQAALCFTEADLPWLRTQSKRGHLLLYRKPLIARINAPGSLAPDAIERIARRLAAALPPA